MMSPSQALPAADQGLSGLAAIVAALAAQYAVVTGARQRVRRLRLDTFDGRLGAVGLTLEHQVADLGERLVLGRLDGSSTVVPVSGLRWPAFADTLPRSFVRHAVVPLTGIRALMAITDEEWHVQRLELHNRDGKTVARVELDEPVLRFAAAPVEVSVRSLRGYEAQARRATLLLTGAGLLAHGNGQDVPAGVSIVALQPPKAHGDRAEPARALLAAVLADFLATMRENLPGLIDDVDTEFLHDFRVAVRRTRSVLKLGRPVLPEVMGSRWEPAFKRLGDATTPVRDLDVYELDLPTMAGWLVATDSADLEPFAAHLRSRRMAERHALVRVLRSAGFLRLVAAWEQELARLLDPPVDLGLPDDRGQGPMPAGRLADVSISRAYRRVARDGAAIGADSPAEDLHGLRKRCKELRYALEVFAPVIDETARRRTVADLKGLQDVLGRFQDTEVQGQALRGFAEEMMADGAPVTALLAMGELIGHLEAEQARARSEFDVAFARFTRPSSTRLRYRLGGGR